jgi:hypothetical protein
MRRALLVLLLVSQSVFANTIAHTDQRIGEIIVLTDKECATHGNRQQGYIVIEYSNTLFGCWKQDDFLVHFYFDNGEVRSFLLSQFKFKTSKEKKGQ